MKLTLDDINRAVKAADYLRSGPTLTICVLTLTNGFQVIGKSACIDAGDFDEAVGRSLAQADALRQVWQLEGYLAMYKLDKGIEQAESEQAETAAALSSAEGQVERLTRANEDLQAVVDAMNAARAAAGVVTVTTPDAPPAPADEQPPA